MANMLVVFALGAIVGSFLNVIIVRLGTGRGVRGRSICFSCGKTLRWYELVPLLSYVLQLGRCRGCHSRISIQYPLVEAGVGLLFLFLFQKLLGEAWLYPYILLLILSAIIVSVLTVIFVYDLRHKIIPDTLSLLFALVALLYSMVNIPFTSVQFFLLALIAGPILFAPFYGLWRISNGRWLGLGDGKLAIGIGMWLGLSGGISALMFAFWIGAVVSVLLVVGAAFLKKAALYSHVPHITMKSEVPFAPFMIIGALLVYFLDWNLFQL